jgi:hypothetical protein
MFSIAISHNRPLLCVALLRFFFLLSFYLFLAHVTKHTTDPYLSLGREGLVVFAVDINLHHLGSASYYVMIASIAIRDKRIDDDVRFLSRLHKTFFYKSDDQAREHEKEFR